MDISYIEVMCIMSMIHESKGGETGNGDYHHAEVAERD